MSEGAVATMHPPKPLPTARPFLTFYTPTFRRPDGLARCMASIARQSAVERVEQLVIPDHPGYGLAAGLFGRIPWYADACRGDYVNILADDDELASPVVVEQLEAFAAKMHQPPVIVARVRKGPLDLPLCGIESAPIEGRIDMTSYILRADVWRAHVTDYGIRYAGDYDHAKALWDAGHRHEFFNVLYAVGAASNGRPEVDWT